MENRIQKQHALYLLLSQTYSCLSLDLLREIENIIQANGCFSSLNSLNGEKLFIHLLYLVREKKIHHTLSPLEWELLLALFIRGDQKMFDRCSIITHQFLSFLDIWPIPSIQECSWNWYLDLRRSITQLFPFLKPHSLSHISHSPRYFLSSIQGTQIYHTLFGHLFPFDPKGDLANSSGILYEEQIDKKQSSLYWNIGPTATVGIDFSPEATAMKSLIEQKQLAVGDEKKYIEQFLPYDGWSYINLQNRRNNNEKNRAYSIEKNGSNQIFIASLSVDSPYYRVQYDLKNNSLAKIRAELEALFSSKTLFTTPSNEWYFFSLSQIDDQKKWKELLMILVKKSYEKIIEKKGCSSDRAMHKAFHELLLYSIARAWQGMALAKLRREGIEKPSLLSTITCREGADRGASINGAMIAMLSSIDENELMKKMLSITIGRPLLFRGRLNEEDRLEGFFALISFFNQKKLSSFLHESLLLAYDLFVTDI